MCACPSRTPEQSLPRISPPVTRSSSSRSVSLLLLPFFLLRFIKATLNSHCLSSIIHHALDSCYVLGSNFSPRPSLSARTASPFSLLKRTRLAYLRSFRLSAQPLCFSVEALSRVSFFGLLAGREPCLVAPFPPASTCALSSILSVHPVIPHVLLSHAVSQAC